MDTWRKTPLSVRLEFLRIQQEAGRVPGLVIALERSERLRLGLGQTRSGKQRSSGLQMPPTDERRLVARCARLKRRLRSERLYRKDAVKGRNAWTHAAFIVTKERNAARDLIENILSCFRPENKLRQTIEAQITWRRKQNIGPDGGPICGACAGLGRECEHCYLLRTGETS